MDLLCKAYSTYSDDDNEAGDESKPYNPVPPLHKRLRQDVTDATHSPMRKPVYRHQPPQICLASSLEAPIPGGYISKRQRAAISLNPKPYEPNHLSSNLSPEDAGGLSNLDSPHDILSTLKQRVNGLVSSSQTPQSASIFLKGHIKPVNAVQWSRTHAHLLASAGMDHTVSIWNVWNKGEKRARILKLHYEAVKDVKWSDDGLFVLSCGYDCTSRLVDVDKGVELQVFKEDQYVEVIKFCPSNHNLFLSGGSKGHLKLWDVRTQQVVHEYVQNLGPILDLEFNLDGKRIITSSDVSKSNLSENAIIVWDVSRQVPLSKQVYAEAYTCPCIRIHPLEPYFIAQSNGNYIAIFSSKAPFRLNKYKRYEGHGVSGFPIRCNFSPDGESIASGSSDGMIYFYNWRTSQLLKKMKAYDNACVDVVFHPNFPNVIASCGWNGEICIFQ